MVFPGPHIVTDVPLGSCAADPSDILNSLPKSSHPKKRLSFIFLPSPYPVYHASTISTLRSRFDPRNARHHLFTRLESPLSSVFRPNES